MTLRRSALSKERKRTKTGRFHEGVTVGKIIRDATIMKEKSRYVIEIDSEGNISKQYDNPPFDRLINCIVVLAPAVFQGVFIERAVCLEIGFGRFVPYKATEIKAVKPNKKKQCTVVQARHRLGVLPWDIIRKLLPTLWVIIQACIDETMAGWTKARLVQDRLQVIGAPAFSIFEAWCSIRIPKDQPLLYALLRLKDEQDRFTLGKNYDHVVITLQKEFALFRSLNPLHHKKYSDEVLKKSKTLERVALRLKKNIDFRGYTTRTFAAIRSLLIERAPKDLSLFDDVCRVFKVKKPPVDSFLDVCELVLGAEKKELLSNCTLRPCRVIKYDKRRAKHADDCHTIGVFGSRDHMLHITNRNLLNKLNRFRAQDGFVKD
jgi:hypothetical protein